MGRKRRRKMECKTVGCSIQAVEGDKSLPCLYAEKDRSGELPPDAQRWQKYCHHQWKVSHYYGGDHEMWWRDGLLPASPAVCPDCGINTGKSPAGRCWPCEEIAAS